MGWRPLFFDSFFALFASFAVMLSFFSGSLVCACAVPEQGREFRFARAHLGRRAVGAFELLAAVCPFKDAALERLHPCVAAADEIPVLALDHALDRLDKTDAQLTRIVELRAFGGLTIEEAAHVLGVSPSTAKRDWRSAKAWLHREIGPDLQP